MGTYSSPQSCLLKTMAERSAGRLRRESWEVLEEMYREGKFRAIGVSNYTLNHMQELLAGCSVKPQVLQTELHPHYQQRELIEFCTANQVHVQAYSSLGQEGIRSALFKSDIVIEVAKQVDKTLAQVLLRWGILHGFTILPKSTNPDHIRENLQVDFEISLPEMKKLDSIEDFQSTKFAWNPEPVL